MFIADRFNDYEVLDAGDGAKLERWGKFILDRPDPQVIWPKADGKLWDRVDARYIREAGGGHWELRNELPDRWIMSHGKLRFYVRPTGFKHTGLFPEQSANWDWLAERVRLAKGKEINALNLFAYTGGATLALALAGARVTHVDAAKGMVQWAKENYALSNAPQDNVRWIVDDAFAFVGREIRRGRKYQAIVMDPPSYGRGPTGEMWKLEDDLFRLVRLCVALLDDDAELFLINSYTTGLQPVALHNVLSRAIRSSMGGIIDAGELAIPITSGGFLPCGASVRWVGQGR